MRTLGLVARALLAGALFLILRLPGHADSPAPIKVSPAKVEIGMNFGGADVLIEGPAPEDAYLIVKVSSRPETVELSKKGKVLGFFWMNTEKAVIENVPTFHAAHSSQPLDSLLTKEEQILLGVDPELSGITRLARATDGSVERIPLSLEEAENYLAGLRDVFVKSGRYLPWGPVRTGDGGWDVHLRLPADAPLGEYDVTVYYVKDGQVRDSQSASFNVRKTGLAEGLGTLATQNAPIYGATSLVVVVLTGLGLTFVLTRGRRV